MWDSLLSCPVLSSREARAVLPVTFLRPSHDLLLEEKGKWKVREGLGVWRPVLACWALFEAQPDMNEQEEAQMTIRTSASTLEGTSRGRRLRAADRAAR